MLGVRASAVLTAGVILQSLGGAQEEPVRPDPLKPVLEAAGIVFRTTPSFHTVVMTFSDTSRKHTIYVRRAPENYNSLNVNELIALAYDEPTPPSDEVLFAALQKRFTIGSIRLEKPSEAQKNWRIQYRLEAHAGLSPEKLRELITITGSTGDELERAFSPRKEDNL